LKRKD